MFEGEGRMPYGGPPSEDIGPTQGIAGGPGPTPEGFDDGTPKPVPPVGLPEPDAQQDAREIAERSGSSASPQRPATRRRRDAPRRKSGSAGRGRRR